MQKLYAWAAKTMAEKELELRVPAISLFKRDTATEHTWVTSYTPGTGPPKQHYFACNGSPRDDQARPLTEGTGGLKFALTVQRELGDNAGIDYGFTGICHQIANRFLRMSLDNEGIPVKVSDAKGYRAAALLYRGEYGSNSDEWDQFVSAYQQQGQKTNPPIRRPSFMKDPDEPRRPRRESQ